MKKNILKDLEYRLLTENLTREEKINLINQVYQDYNRQIDEELNLYLAKQYTGATLEIGSAGIPVGAVSRLYGKALVPVGKKLLSSGPVQQVIGKSLNKGLNSALTALENDSLINLPLVPKGIQTKMGRKYPNDILTSSIDSAINGGIYGLGRGMVEGENPIQTATKDAALGAGIGGVLGGVTGQLEKTALANKLKSYKTIEKPTKADRKQHINDVNNYYRYYEQDVNTPRNDIGNIKLPSSGMSETNRQKFDKSTEVVDLSKNLRQAKYIHEELPVHEHNKFDIQKFHRLSDGRNDYLVTENSKGSHYFYKITDSTLTGPEPEGWNPNNIIPDSLTGFNSSKWLNPRASVGIESLSNFSNVHNTTQSIINDYGFGNIPHSETTQKSNQGHYYSNKRTDSTLKSPELQGWNPNNIVPDPLADFNTPKWLNPRASVGIEALSNFSNVYNTTQSIINDYVARDFPHSNTIQKSNNETSSIVPKVPVTQEKSPTMLQGRIERKWNAKDKVEIPTGYAASLDMDSNQSPSLFTVDEVGKMSREEFDKNEGAIMKQLQTGGFNTPQESKNYGGYINTHTGDNRIFTAEEIGGFTGKEFSYYEPAINAQMKSIGIPTNNEIQNSFGVIYVEPYTRADGVQVRGYYRSR